MHKPSRISSLVLSTLTLVLAFPAHATRDPEFPPNAIVVLARYDSANGNMATGKFASKVDYICDGVDDQVEIQKAIQLASQTPPSASEAGQGGTVILVGGKFYISDTITLEKASAVTIRGLHGRGANASGSEHTVGYGGWAANDNNTALIWVGVDGGTMINVHGSLNCTFQNFLLYGKNGAESNVAGKLMHITWESDWASGGHRLVDLTFQSADEGLVLGNSAEDLSCDNIYGEHLGFGRMTKGIVLKNAQSVAHTFVALGSSYCDTVINIENGGNIAVFGGNDSSSNTYVHIDGAGGVNTEPLVFQGIRIETNAGVNHTPIFVSGSSDDVMHVSVIGCAILGGLTSYSQYTFDLGQGIFVTARDCVLTGKVANLQSDASDYPASLILDSCAVRLPTDVKWSNLITLDDSEYCKLKIKDCYFVDGPLQALDYNGLTWPEFNEPVTIWSDVVDARTVQTVSFDVYGKGDGGQDVVFVPTEVGLQVVTLPTGITGAPSFQWGWSGNASGLHGTAIYSIPGVNSTYSAAAASTGGAYVGRTDAFTATVSTGATVTSGQPLNVRFFWKGFVQRTE